VCVRHPCSVFLDVYSVPFLFYLTTCVCVCNSFYGPMRECLRVRRFQVFLITAPPSVLALAVLGALGVWIQNGKKNIKLKGLISSMKAYMENPFPHTWWVKSANWPTFNTHLPTFNTHSTTFRKIDTNSPTFHKFSNFTLLVPISLTQRVFLVLWFWSTSSLGSCQERMCTKFFSKLMCAVEKLLWQIHETDFWDLHACKVKCKCWMRKPALRMHGTPSSNLPRFNWIYVCP